ncbi:hypothetical protein [Methylomagnum sp.]
MNTWIPSLAASALLLSSAVKADNGLSTAGGHLYPAQPLSGSFSASRSQAGLGHPLPSLFQSQPVGASNGLPGAGTQPAKGEEQPGLDDDPEPPTEEPEEEE